MGKIAEVQEVTLTDLIPYANNAKIHSEDQVTKIASSIREFGFLNPVLIDKDKNIIAGHGRVMAAKKLGLERVPSIYIEGLTEAQRKAYILADNRLGELADWDMDLVNMEIEALDDMDFDISLTGFEMPEIETEEIEIVEDDVPEKVETRCKLGDLWQLGGHRLICGDSTDIEVIDRLMDGVKADMVFTDPPYGMKKENKITFRNLITWDKGNGQGQLSSGFMMYPIADEKCLFVVCGIQCLTLNADQYWEEYEPIRKYLYDERMKCGWDVPTMKTIAGHSDKNRDHWTSKSQFNLPTKEVYEKFQKWAKDHNVKAFEKEYEQLRKEYEKLRAYFDNTHDNMNNVWHFDRAGKGEREHTGGHATPKPIALCSRAIKSSSREGEIVLDVFGGSGSTLIACEQLNRKCYMCELDEHYCDVIIQRWENLTGRKAELVEKPY